jgi:hypothetical protein
MPITQVKVGAVIPTAQYSNLQPEITVEVTDGDVDAAKAEAMQHIVAFSQAYAEPGKALQGAVSNNRQLVQCYVGGQIYYDEAKHEYTNEAGDVYLSGSKYAAQFEKPFDAQFVAKRMAAKIDCDPADIVAMWELKADVSKGLGTAMHAALELYGRYAGLCKALDKETHLHDNPMVKRAVELFYAGREAEEAVYEPFVVDHQLKRTGQIDRLQIVGDKVCRVQDFKTNTAIEKHLPSYRKQLEFYGGIMQAAGWRVDGYDIFWWNGQRWEIK